MPVEAHHDQPGQEEGQEGQQGWGQPRHVCTQVVGRDTVAGSPVPKLPQDTAVVCYHEPQDTAVVCYHEPEMVLGEWGWVQPWP